tara:strand:+ start:475 stop:720 length:246 start_codon:yes stop_codon:yes gene_type:complete
MNSKNIPYGCNIFEEVDDKVWVYPEKIIALLYKNSNLNNIKKHSTPNLIQFFMQILQKKSDSFCNKKSKANGILALLYLFK